HCSRIRKRYNIECSAMAQELLGASFEIHGGGLDLQFPHHENEIAQSACAHPEGSFARYWLHNEMLQVEGRKMSKSLGNFFTVRDLLDQGVPGEVIRLVFLMTHYRSPMDWTEDKKNVALGHLRKWSWLKNKRLSDPDRKFTGEDVDPAVIDALCNDLNTHEALTLVFKMASQVELDEVALLDSPATVRFFDTLAFLGFTVLAPERQAIRNTLESTLTAVQALPRLQDRFDVLRAAAMVSKDFSSVDTLKSALVAAGVEVRMSKAGVELVPGPDFDPAKLEALQ
ncbi:MAG: cysteine--tRNA ligase, partial [Tabrizicola sp.]|nr:cysteine--tRNA ligase [Tabrizicola sp.]